MNKRRWESVRRVFDHLADKSPSHRSDYLDIVCEDDAGLRSEVERLLAANDALEADESVALFRGARKPHDSAMSKPADALAMPRTLGGYDVGERIGSGGMGAVFAARHAEYGEVALKVLPGFLVSGESAAARFRNEALALAQLDHSGLCALYESFVADGFACIAMERVVGEDLTGVIARGAADVGDAARIVAALADALAVAHAQEVYHRDVKPGNVILPEAQPQGPKLIDFGIAKFADSKLTATGQAVGSPRYMSPEQWRGGTVDGRTDLWSLGVLWYEMLTAERPFEGAALADVAAAVLTADVPPLPEFNTRGQSLAESERHIRALLQKEPSDRVQTCDELAGRLATLV